MKKVVLWKALLYGFYNFGIPAALIGAGLGWLCAVIKGGSK